MKKAWALPLLLATFSAGLLPVAAAAENPASRYQLEKVVMLIRHGVRPQTDTASLEKATGKTWPEWGVPDGNLTGHGYAGMLAQGAYQLATWRAHGLKLNSTGTCPDPEQVFLWAAPDQRTKATGVALLDGMFPGCGVAMHSTANKHDPLFDTVEMGIAKPDQQVISQQVLEKMGSAENAQHKYQQSVNELRHAVCANEAKSCAFLDKPWGVEINDKGKAKLTGPVSKGASIGETIRLQYSENLPLSQVAFGHASNAQQVSQLMALHAAKYDLVSNTIEYASHGGSVLMRQLLRAITPDKKGELNSPLVILVGHDSNISQIQTMLGFNWQLPVYPRNDIPPGGSLVMERYRDTQTGEQLVHVTFSARTLDQWRKLTPLNNQHPLPVAEFIHPGCHSSAVGELCPLETFVKIGQQHLVADGADVSVFN